MDLMKLDSLSGSVCWTHSGSGKRPLVYQTKSDTDNLDPVECTLSALEAP
jgi:hypothetical protein